MKILAFDTTLQACSAAVTDTDYPQKQASRFEAIEKGHAEMLVPMIQDVMDEAETGFSDLDRIIVTIGPGAFTGVRIGLSTARGIALGLKAKIQGVTSLEAMALTALSKLEASTQSTSQQFAVCTDARRGEVYLQMFDSSGIPTSQAQAVTPEEAAQALNQDIGLVMGNGGPLLKAELPLDGRDIEFVLPELKPDAQFMLALADREFDASKTPSPLYLRAPDAKPQSKKLVARANG